MQPVQREERIESVDVLRGFSLLGILLLNINSFALPFAAYMNPVPYGGATGANLTWWLLAQTLFEGKMRAIFSMLFGTSGFLLLDRAERRGAGIEAADIYYRRTLWLIFFGLVHAYLIWYGDILYPYGVIGLILFPFRKLSSKALIWIGALIVLVHSAQMGGAGYYFRTLAPLARMADAPDATEEQKNAKKELGDLEKMFAPSKEEIEKEVKTHRGGWVGNAGLRAGQSASFQFQNFFQFMFLDVTGMLFLGMGLAKAGVFSAARSYRFYSTLILAGFGLGIPLNYWAGRMWIADNFSTPGFFAYIGSTTDPGRFLVAGGYIGLVMVVCKAGALRWLTFALAAVGRTALSNYLLTSIVMTLIFNGYGLGFFAKFERAQLLWFVAAMWLVNLIASPIWLRYYRFGPAEWAWRSLTYWQRQPMRIQPTLPEAESPVS